MSVNDLFSPEEIQAMKSGEPVAKVVSEGKTTAKQLVGSVQPLPHQVSQQSQSDDFLDEVFDGPKGYTPRQSISIEPVSKVVTPQIRSADGTLITDATAPKISRPDHTRLSQWERQRAAELADLAAEEEQRRAEREAVRPDKLLAQLEYLSRQVKKQAKEIAQLKKSQSNDG